MQLGMRMGLTAPKAPYNPAVLFAGGAGAWYDPSDISTLFKDTAGTTPVTADGDAVARINDKSGNGFHLLQSTSGARPLYKITGSRATIRFDGTDDFMSCATMDLSAVSVLSLFAGGVVNTAGGNRWVAEYGTDITTLSGFTMDFASTNKVAFNHRGASATITQVVSEPSARPLTFVAGGVSSIAAPSIYARLNGVQSVTTTTATGGGFYGNRTLYIGSRAGTSLFHNGDIGQMIILHRIATAIEILRIEKFIGLKVGL